MNNELRLIKKYPNRRLYDTKTSSYITLADIKQMVLKQEEFQVVDAKTNANLAKSAKNLPDSKWIAPEGLNVYDVLDHPTLLITQDAVKLVEQRFAPAAAL